MSETWLWTASFFIWDGALFHERVCIVHINNSTVGSHLSEHVGTGGCSDNRNVRIIELLIKSF